jgi:threonine dehydratase
MGALAQGMIEAAVALIVLHSPDGHVVLVNPDGVTSMHSAIAGQKNQNISDKVRCLVNTTDGKFVSVIETCDAVRELIRQAEGSK